MDTVIVLRLAERILAVLIGGIAIYLGYRLFLSIPQLADSEGRFTLPWNTSIGLSRVGPGVFFALFGSIVVGTSLFRSIQYEDRVPVRNEENANVTPAGAQAAGRFVGSTQVASRNDAQHDARMLLQRDIAVLNNIPSQLDSRLEPHNRSSVEIAIHRIKLALMEAVWDDWGDRAALREWIDSADRKVPAGIKKEAVEYYQYGMKGNR